MNATRPTMRHVADMAGVSLKTVSRVINAEAGVTPATAERVTAAIAELGFERNDLAASLRHGRSSSTLGLVIEDVANPFYSAIAQAVEAAARDRGFLLITASAREDAERERELVSALLRRRVDALLIVPAGPDHRYLAASARAVFLDRPPLGIEADTVLLDDHGGARSAVEHLIAQGHRRIAFLGDRLSVFTATERRAGYRQALDAARIERAPELERTELVDSAAARRATFEILRLEDPPTALFTGQNLITIGAVRALRELGLQWTVAIAGFDDVVLGDLVEPGISVIAQDPYELGRSAGELLFNQGPEPRQVVVPTQLIARGSGEIPPPDR